MKLVLFVTSDRRGARVGVLRDGGLVDASDVVEERQTPQLTMEGLIDDWDERRVALHNIAEHGELLPLDSVRLLSPLPRPGKILCCRANYWERAQREPRPLGMFLKNPDAVIGPNDTIVLPDTTDPWMFMHEAELALVLKGPAKNVRAEDWTSAVFGYTCLIDVSARGEGRKTWGGGTWLGKSFDTFCPLGPCIATADTIREPNDLHVRLWNNGQLRHNYSTDDMEHRVPELIEFASSVMTLRTGDVIACGTNHEGLGPLQDGEVVEIEIEGIARMSVGVRDPLRRSWPRGIYMGADSTNHEAVRRYRPDEAHLLRSQSDS